MRCLYCGKRLSLLHKLSRREFCNDEHHSLYMDDQDSLGLARLIEAKQVTRSKSPPRRSTERAPAAAPPPFVERFVTQFPNIQCCVRPAFGAGQELPVAITVALPPVELKLGSCKIRLGESEASFASRDVRPDSAPTRLPEILATECFLRYPQSPPPVAPALSEPPKPGLIQPAVPEPRGMAASGPREISNHAIETTALSYPGFLWESALALSVAPGLPATGAKRVKAGTAPETGRPAAGEFHASESIPASLNVPASPPAVTDAASLSRLEDLVAGFAALSPFAINDAVFPHQKTAQPVLSSPQPSTGVRADLPPCAFSLAGSVKWSFDPATRPPHRDETAEPIAKPGTIAWPAIGLAEGGIQPCRCVDLAETIGATKVRMHSSSAAPVDATLPLNRPPSDSPVAIRGLTTAGLRQLSRGPSSEARSEQMAPPATEPTAAFPLPPKSTAEMARCVLPSAAPVPLTTAFTGVSAPPRATDPTPLHGSSAAAIALPDDPASAEVAGLPPSDRLRPLVLEKSAPPAAPAVATPLALAPDTQSLGESVEALTAPPGEASDLGYSPPQSLTTKLFPLSLEHVVALADVDRSKTKLTPEPVSPTLSMPRLNARPVKDTYARTAPNRKLGPPVWQRILKPAAGKLRATPTSIRWFVMAIPLIGILTWHVAFREQSVIATTTEPDEVTSALAVRWQNFQENVSSRAAISLTDDFRSGLSEWTGVDGWSKSWEYDESGFVRPGGWAIYKPTIALSDYQFEFAAVIEQGGVNWVFRAADSNNYYYARVSIIEPGPLPKGAIDWYAVVDGKRSARTRTVLPFELRNEKMYRVRLVARGNGFTTFLDDRVVDFFEDSRLPTGGVGFFNSRGDHVRLRWISVIHQYDMLGRLCALIAPYDFQNATRSVTQ